MEASINVTIKSGAKTYDIKLEIPSGTPTNENPYTFSVSETDNADNKLLDLAVGAGTNFHVNLSPPQSLLPSGTVESLAVTVEDGTYTVDPTTKKGKFT